MNRRTSLGRLVFALAVALALGGCSTYATYLRDAITHPPKIEAIRTSSGQQIDLYSIDIGPPPRRALFFVSGSGCASLAYFMRAYFENMTGSWTIYAVQKAGVAKNDMGFFCSQSFNDHYYFEALRERYNAALRKVIRRHGEVAGVLGVSEGGDFAALLAQDNPQVRRLAVIGSGGLPWRAVGKILDARAGDDAFARTFAEITSAPLSTVKTALGYPYRYWSSIVDFDPAAVYLSLKIPILVVFGEADQSVPLESARFLEARFQEAGKENFQLLTIAGARHALIAGGKNLKPEVMTRLDAFFAQENARRQAKPDSHPD